MNFRKLLFLFLFTVLFFQAFAKRDTTKMKYVHSYISINGEYGKDLNSQQGWTFRGAIGLTISSYSTLKETYFGIAALGGYRQSSFIGSSYQSTIDASHIFYKGESSGSYTEGFLLAGLGLKLPEHTTRYAFELRVMLGAALCGMPAITHFSSSISPFYSDSGTYHENYSREFSFALDAGIGFGYKISNRWGLMANCDFMAARFYSISSGTILTFSGGVIYTFGRMIGNFTY